MRRDRLLCGFVAVGALFATMRTGAWVAYFTFGPGSLLNAEAVPFREGLGSLVMAIATTLTWPVIVHRAISGGLLEAWQSLFYLWYPTAAEVPTVYAVGAGMG